MSKAKQRNYWFKRRRYGYGWTPTTWQGWGTLLGFLVVVIGGTFLLRGTPRHEWSDQLTVYLLLVLLATVGLIAIAYTKGPRPKWRWGKSKRDNPDEDF